MKLGAQPKKLGILGALLLVLVYALYTNVIAPSDEPGARRQASARTAAAVKSPASLQPEAFGFAVPDAKPRPAARSRAAAVTRPEFRMGSRDKQADPVQSDPTLRLDLLAKLQDVKLEGGDRNLFQFGAAPLPKTPDPKIIPNQKPTPMPAAPAGPPPPPPPPTAPPIPLKFYGYSSQPAVGPKRAFFLDGDDIIVAVEGEVMKSRYKIIRIGINSVVVEDVQFQQQQTLPLEEQPAPQG